MRLNLPKPAPIGTIALALSIGLHGLLLVLPLPERDFVVEQTQPETLEPVAIRPASPIAPPKPTIALTPSPTPQPTPQATPTPVQPAIVRPAPPPAASVPAPSPVPSPAASPVVGSPSPTPELSPSPSPTPELSPSPSPSPDPFNADFPHFENAQAGCFGSETCHLIEGEASFREVGRTMMEQLEAKGYTVRPRDDLEDDTGRKVYEVSKGEETQYLTVLSVLELGRTVYVLAEKPMTLADLQSENAAETPGG